MSARVIPVLAALSVLCAWSRGSCAESTNTVQIFGGDESEVGWGFGNRFAVPAKEAAAKKLKAFTEAQRDVTLREFLGGDILHVNITFVDESLGGFEKAQKVLQSLLRAVLLRPECTSELTFQGPMWAEGTHTTIRALVFYTNRHVGRIHCDATERGSSGAGGRHVFFEDSDGTYWWDRLDTKSPRKPRQEPANESVERTGAPRVETKAP